MLHPRGHDDSSGGTMPTLPSVLTPPIACRRQVKGSVIRTLKPRPRPRYSQSSSDSVVADGMPALPFILPARIPPQ